LLRDNDEVFSGPSTPDEGSIQTSAIGAAVR